MKILITGGAGFVGSNIANRLHEDHDVTVVDNLRYGSRANLFRSVKFIHKDFQQLDDLDYDVLIHCATVNIIASQKDPIGTFKTNATDTIRLIEKFKEDVQFINKFNGKIIYTSIASVYGNQKEMPLSEDSDVLLRNAYDQSKYIIERYLRLRGNFTTLRLSNVYGINQRPGPYCGVVGKFINSGLNHYEMTAYGNDTRDYTYVSDVVDAVELAVNLDSLNTELNISTGIETSTDQLITYISYLLDIPVAQETKEPRGIDGIKRRVLDNTKARYMLGWEPIVELKEGLLKTIEWQKNTL